jgi:hypothetical protein
VNLEGERESFSELNGFNSLKKQAGKMVASLSRSLVLGLVLGLTFVWFSGCGAQVPGEFFYFFILFYSVLCCCHFSSVHSLCNVWLGKWYLWKPRFFFGSAINCHKVIISIRN